MDDMMSRLYKTNSQGGGTNPVGKGYNTRRAQRQSITEAEPSSHAARIGLPPRANALPHGWPSGPTPAASRGRSRRDVQTPDARDPAELAALRASREQPASIQSVVVPDDVDQDSEQMPHTNPKADPFNFIQAVQEGTADYLEFVYLTPRKTLQGDSNPYNLRIVPVSSINKDDYYTLGISGVTHFREGSAEFTALEQWQREFKLHSKVRRLPFFRKYRRWKSYFVWRSLVRNAKMTSASRQLAAKLFTLSPLLRTTLFETRKKCESLSEIGLCRVELEKNKSLKRTYTVDEFAEEQAICADECSAQLAEYRSDMVSLVSSACEQHMAAAYPPNTESGGGMDLSLDAMSRARASNREREQAGRLSYSEILQRRAMCTRLTNFVRLCDYFVVDALRGMVAQSAQQLLGWLTPTEPDQQAVEEMIERHEVEEQLRMIHDLKLEANEGDEDSDGDLELRQEEEDQMLAHLNAALDKPVNEPTCTPLFEVQLVHQKAQLVLKPSRQQLEATLMNTVGRFVDVVSSFEAIVTAKECSTFTAPQFNDRAPEVVNVTTLDIQAMITEQPLFVSTMDALRKQIGAGVESAVRYSQYIEQFKSMYYDAIHSDPSQLVEPSGDLTPFYKAISKYRRQQEYYDLLEDRLHTGMLMVQIESVKALFSPAPQHFVDQIHFLLPKLAFEANQNLALEVNNGVRQLTAVTQHVSEHVEWLKLLEQVYQSLKDVDERYELVRELYDLISEEAIQVDPQQLAEFQSTRPSIEHLKHVIDAGDAEKDAKTQKFSEQLQENVQQLKDDVLEIKHKSFDPMLSDPGADPETALSFVTELRQNIKALHETNMQYEEWQMLFGINNPMENDEMEAAMNDVTMKERLWNNIVDLKNFADEWSNSSFEDVDAAFIEKRVDQFHKVSYSVQKALPNNDAITVLSYEVERWREVIPILSHLKNDALLPCHWEELGGVTKLDLYAIVSEENFKVKDLEAFSLFKWVEAIERVSVSATQEQILEEQLLRVSATWEAVEFVALDHKPDVYKDVYIMGGIDDVYAALEETQMQITTILGSRFVGRLRERVDEWERKLRRLSETVEAWVDCQCAWMYLESIFSSPDIVSKLPVESKVFGSIDKSWKETLRKVKHNPLAIIIGTRPGLLEMFQKHNEQLDVIQKNLERYLEQKRVLFPRFYFLGDDDLLEILSQAKNPQAVQPHLCKMFDAIKSATFEGTEKVVAIVSPEDEVVTLDKPFKTRSEVEKWLLKIEDGMRTTLWRETKDAVSEYDGSPDELQDFLLGHLTMVVLTVMQIHWAQQVEVCLQSDKPTRKLKAFYTERVTELERMADLTRLNLEQNGRITLCTCITLFVHARDVVEQMITEGVNNTSAFGWAKQLRYIWDTETSVAGNCFVKMTNTSFQYGYEYQGCQPRLVITPLTDRVYITITGAIHLALGAAPAGPAGTGKTESTKDLAKAMAYQCIVYNCSEGVTYLMIAKFFSGLVQTGAWACFDEFNRINIEVLSVIASQMLTIRNGLLSKKSKFVFEGREIRLVSTVGVIITMNPGYAGRTELPDNLKVLFRTVAVMVPDYQLIAEVVLFSEGYYGAKNLSVKMRQLYKLSSEQLSSQDHYDFGMRAVKSVLVMAGGLKRANPDLPEEVCLIRAMVESNVPKFLAADIPLFNAIVADLFPGVTVPVQSHGELSVALEAEVIRRGLQASDAIMNKIMQFYETCIVRHGVALVGPAGSGKSEIRSTLARTLTLLREAGSENEVCQRVQEYELNPKSISMRELYGYSDPITNEWSDGIVASVARVCIKDGSDDHKWIICDGPIDTLWIESMNSVLDDSKLLCLDSGERIKLNNTIHMIFEAQDLAVASPATVSRLGMVYVDGAVLGWQTPLQSFLANPFEQGGLPDDIPTETRDQLAVLYATHVPAALAAIRKAMSELMPSLDQNLVSSMSSLLRTLLAYGGPDQQGVNWNAGTTEQTAELVLLIFAFCLIWGLGGNVDTKSQLLFDEWTREHLFTIPWGQEYKVYGYYVDFTLREFKPWSDLVPQFKYDPAAPFFSILVPTVDTVCLSTLLETNLSVDKPMLVTGLSGVGKSVMISDCLSRRAADVTLSMVYFPLQFSAQTSSSRTQLVIEDKLEKKRRGVLGAPAGAERIVVFVDDLNMPKLQQFGAAPPIELLRQILGQSGAYDRSKLTWTEYNDVVQVAACGEPSGGRSVVTPRLLRFFHMLGVPQVAERSMVTMFKSILGNFLGSGGFSNNLKNLAGVAVQATINVFTTIVAHLLPTPTRCHYTFNLRDVAKVIQGMMQVKPRALPTEDHLLKLWVHETMRSFHDRLIDTPDKDFFKKTVGDIMAAEFAYRGDIEAFWSKPPIFGDYIKGVGVPLDEKAYEQITDRKKLLRVLSDYLDDHNLNASKPMSLVLFQDCIDHISRVARIIAQPRGNALLVGVGGSGKQSVTKLASHVAGAACVGIELTRSYSLDNFREDLRQLFFRTGLEGEKVAFLLNGSQIVDESFLEDVNNVLNSGEVPSLFEHEDRIRILEGMSPYMKEHNLPAGVDSCYQQFILRVRDELHICLCMSPVGAEFRTRCRMFPSLVNCTTIDWFNEWPAEALESVAMHFLSQMDLGDSKLVAPLASMCIELHDSVRIESKAFSKELNRVFYVTPTSYLDFIQLYQDSLDDKRGSLTRVKDKLGNGLRKLAETETVIADLEEKITTLQPELDSKSAEAYTILEQVAAETEKANIVRTKVASEEKVVAVQAAEANMIAADAQADLDKALPALNEATEALDALNKNDIVEMKGYKSPPAAVVNVMNAVLLLFGYPKRQQNWDEAKLLMSDMNFLERAMEYDKDNISVAIRHALKTFVDEPEFTPDCVRSKSAAAASLCMWVKAMYVYALVVNEVAPKQAKLEEAQQTLATAESSLKDKQDALAAVEAALSMLHKQQAETMAEKNRLEAESELCKNRLARADKLTQSLGSEKIRWTSKVAELGDDIDECTGSVFLASAFVSYLAPFDSSYRQKLTTRWTERCGELEIPVHGSFSLSEIMGDPVLIRQWNIDGLPHDALSIENGIVISKLRRWPLMIDPQGQARFWIGNMESKNNLKVVKPTTPNYLRTLEAAIRNGNPVVLEDVDEHIDPAMDPVLLRQTFKLQGRLLLRLGDSDVDYDPMFKLYITTKLPNPHYTPELCIKVTLINFTVTVSGLEDQLLAEVVMLERPDLEEEKNKLIKSMAADKKQIAELEDKILTMLKEAEGNILDNQALVDTLEESKKTSNSVGLHLAEAETTNEQITLVREDYRRVAVRGSTIYFVIANLARVNEMYQYSLDFFKALFANQISTAEKNSNVQTRCKTLITNVTASAYENVCRGLFEKDKLLFSFMLCCNVLRNSGEITLSEWGFFSYGVTAAGAEEVLVKPVNLSMSDKAWNRLCSMGEQVGDMAGLCKNMIDHPMEWEGILNADEPSLDVPTNLPIMKLKLFGLLLIFRCVRPERLVHLCMQFVKQTMGRLFVEPVAVEMSRIYKDMNNTTPAIFIFATGCDPSDALIKFAEDHGLTQEQLHMVSLGQGQGPRAEKFIETSTSSGDWVFLQNCHLAKTFMTRLEQLIDGLSASVHPSFRLWLSTSPCDHFPITILQNGVKATMEPPAGLRANLLKSVVNNLSEDFFQSSAKPVEFQKLLFGMLFFHGILQERKKFGPLGWNIKYEFNDSDLQVSMEMVKMYLDESPVGVPWETLNYMISEISYGGRVTDVWDRRCIAAIVSEYFNPDALQPNYKLSSSEQYTGLSHEDTSLAALQAHVDRLPYEDSPVVFGMHPNANITFLMQESTYLSQTFSTFQSNTGEVEALGMSPEERIQEQAQALLVALPKDLQQEEGAKSGQFDCSSDGVLDSMTTVLGHEMGRFNKLLRVIRGTLRELLRAIKGEVIMSDDLDAVFQALVTNTVPPPFVKAGYPSLKPFGSWVSDLSDRIAFVRSWLVGGPPPCFWISGFYFPQGFMTSVLQSHARKYTIAIDTLSFAFGVTKIAVDEVTDRPADGVLCHGMFMDGAKFDWDQSLITESTPGVMHCNMPVIHFIPSANYHPKPSDYQAPLYKTSLRAGTLSTTGHSTNFVVAVSLPSDKDPKHWVLKGTALLCQLND